MADAPAAAPKPCCVCLAPGGKHCTRCKSRHYCSKKCQLVDWNEGGHKAHCRQMTAAFQDRLLDELMPAKKVKEEPAIAEDVLLADGSKAAARLSAVQTTAVKASAPNDDLTDWRGMCAICLDALPFEVNRQIFYNCCCKRICKDCWVKCQQYDKRCPLCRTPLANSEAEALRWLQKHVDKGNADAQAQLGGAYHDGFMGLKKNPKRAVQLYQLAAARGHAQAQSRLGCIYQHGNGDVKIDYKAAALWYRRAAEQGYPEAQYNLGAMIYHGKGVAQLHDEGEEVAKSSEEAVKWFRLAAAQGHSEALFNLGLCHVKGLGVPEDDHEALRLCKRAAALGHAGATVMARNIEAYLAHAARSGRPT